MRTKRSARGRFHRSSPRPDSATAASRPLPPPITDDISESSDNSADSLEVQNSSESDDSVSDSSDDEMKDDFDEKTCLECNKGEGLIFCGGIGCPIALHEKCIFGQPMYDGGKFHCPYCWYKLQQARKQEWRVKVMLAKKDLGTFINFRPQCGDKEKRKNKRAKKKDMNVGKIISETNQSEHVNIKVVDKNGVVADCGKISVTRAHGIVDDEVHTEQGKNDQHDDDEKDEGTNANKGWGETQNPPGVAEKTSVDDAFHGSPREKSRTFNISEIRDQVRMVNGEQMNKGTPAANVSCSAKAGASESLDVPDSETGKYEQVNIQKADLPKKSTIRPCTRSTKATREPKEVGPLKKARQSEMNSKKIIDPPSVHEKHKRMLWRPEEEDMLRELEGDRQHSSKVKYPRNDQSREASPAHGIVEGMEYEKNDQRNDDEKDEETNANEEHMETFTAQRVLEKSVIDGPFHESPGANSEIANKSQKGRISMKKEEQMNNKASTASVRSAIEDKAVHGPEVVDSETKSYIAGLRHANQRNSLNSVSPKNSAVHLHTNSTEATRKSVDEFSALKMPKQRETPTKNIDLPFGNGKRKRILWKPEEEEMIREGVQKFSTTKNKNIPWRKILEFGNHVFDPSRNPSDLKDKWKKLGKES